MATEVEPPESGCDVMVHTVNANEVSTVQHKVIDFFRDNVTLPNPNSGFQWLHVPVNNPAWVEKCIRKCNYDLDPRTWTLKLRPALSPSIDIPLHSRHMEPSCSEGNHVPANANGPRAGPYPRPARPNLEIEDGHYPLLALYLPYMNWDTYGDYCSLRKIYEQRGQPQIPNPLHPRRTLDQFYYSSLADTSARDRDQTISKWTGSNIGQEGRSHAAGDSLLMMIDQLWCWVLDEKTVVSFFPSRETQDSGSNFKDLYNTIRDGAHKCETVWDMYSLLVKEATTYLFSQENRKFIDLAETYGWVIGKKAAYQTTLFQEFQQDHSIAESSSNFLDDRELKLALEVADILDELKMIRHLVEKQRKVLKSLISALRRLNPSHNQTGGESVIGVTMSNISSRDNSTMLINPQVYYHNQNYGVENTIALAQGVAGAARDNVISADEMLVFLLTEIDFMRNDADYTHKMLLDLMDLKQKTASLAEARSTTQQGRAVMLFTVVTIIFLPLSFFTSYFGQNVSEITGDDNNPTTWDLWKVGTPITLVVILLALLIAYYIMKPNSQLWCWKSLRPGRYRVSVAV